MGRNSQTTQEVMARFEVSFNSSCGILLASADGAFWDEAASDSLITNVCFRSAVAFITGLNFRIPRFTHALKMYGLKVCDW